MKLEHQGDFAPGSGNSTCVAPRGLAFACLEPIPVSKGFPYSILIVSAALTILAIVKYLLEIYMMRRKNSLHGRAYARLSPRNQRTLVNHHVSLAIKVCLFCFAIYPFSLLVLGHNFDARFSPQLTIGDMLFACSHIYSAMYLFELCYRQGISPITWVHHICTIIIAQVALVFTTTDRSQDTTIEMTLCFAWGMFDLSSEALPHLTMVLYRLCPTSHLFLYRSLRTAFFVSVLSTTIEIGVVCWFYAALFDRWSIYNKVLTPTLFAAFVAAQVWSAIGLWVIGSEQRNGMKGGGRNRDGGEGAAVRDNEIEMEAMEVVVSVEEKEEKERKKALEKELERERRRRRRA